jgi:hypothetical protein
MLSVSERPALKINGFVMSLVTVLLTLAGVWSLVEVVRTRDASLL